jgi:general secretion pathway protein D
LNGKEHSIVKWVILITTLILSFIATGTATAVVPGTVAVFPIVLGQTNGLQNPSRLSKREVGDLLEQARVAIEAGNLDQADALVRRAESAKVRYSLLHFGATPAKVRRELTAAQRAEGFKSSSLPGRPVVAVPSDGEDKLTLEDPFVRGSIPEPGVDIRLATQQSSAAGAVLPAVASIPILPPPEQSLESQDHQVRSDVSAVGRLPESRDSNLAQSAPLIFSAAPESIYQPAAVPTDGDESVTSPSTSLFTIADRESDTHRQAISLMARARQALVTENISEAEQLSRQVLALNVPAPHFLPGEDRPAELAWEIQQAKQRSTSLLSLNPVSSKSSAAVPAASPDMADGFTGSTGLQHYDVVHLPENDTTPNIQSATEISSSAGLRFAQFPKDFRGDSTPTPNQLPQTDSNTNRAVQLLAEGESALGNQDRAGARSLFQEAQRYAAELDSVSKQRLEGHLQMLTKSSPGRGRPDSSAIDFADQGEQVIARQLQAELTKRQIEASRLREKNPKQALQLLQEVREQVEKSNLSSAVSSQLTRRVDISIKEIEEYIQQHRAEIELDEQNESVLAEIERSRVVKVKVQQDIAELVDQFNQLLDEQRFEEAEVIAQRLRDLAPDEMVVQQIWQTAKFIRREKMNRDLNDRKEESNWLALWDVDNSSVQEVGDDREIVYDQKKWDDFIKNRPGSSERTSRMTERELEIQRRLKTPVQMRYEDRPLREVIDSLSQLTGVNIHLDARGLNQEGVTSDTPVTFNLNREIQLKSALNLILEPLHLSYVIKDEVLKITSEQLRDGELQTYTYNVADLVIPIPNFVPTNNIGLQGLLNDAQASMGYGGGFGAPGPITLVNNPHTSQGGVNDNNVLAQQFTGANQGAPTPAVPFGAGPGGLGGGAMADFDSLIDLIISTVATETWAENGGGEAEIRPFPTNLSLVVSQTQAVHEEIADLLEQLRRLQDLQVTIEVRFINLKDDFFERVGIDFDLNIEDNTGLPDLENGATIATPGALVPGASFEPRRHSAAVGISETVQDYPNYTGNLDVEFRQNSFDLTPPQFGGMGTEVGQFGFALLTELEATFFIKAVQGDNRTNVLNAPKVTLFNGQQAFVADAVQRPFVISVIPVVGEFAAAQQPVIVVLSEGTLMSIQAVVSDNRRYVRLTVVPFFSDIGDVDTFTFEGSTTSASTSTTTDKDSIGNPLKEEEVSTAVNSVGTTVQLPTFQFVSVVTTVSVPDRGTVLLGGIKRLSEGRNERGIPLLSKLPYVNRLFRNVGIGRQSDSLMMMVTPRIIIQEEEEENLGISSL